VTDTPHPDACARRAVHHDRELVAQLRGEARASVASVRGGASLIHKDRPEAAGTALLDEALDGAARALALVGTIDGAVVGYVLARHELAEGAVPVASIDELWVTPDAREMGVGEVLLDGVATWAQEWGCVALDADALPGDRATKNFFEQHGMVARAIRVERRFDGAPS
jgi:GNAT superfamily N-acetyltransferase